MPLNYNHMKNAYVSLLEPLREQFFSKELTCMPITTGKKYQQSPMRLMYVGRAVNGWHYEWQEGTTSELVEQVFEHRQDMEAITQGVVEYKDGDELCKYNYNRSPFWQLCRAILKQYGVENDWADYVAWTNLYKVSYSKRGNPNNDLIRKTIKGCANILFFDIFCELPTHIVFVTDDWWIKPTGKNIDETAFTDMLGIDINEGTNNGVVIGSGVVTNEYFNIPNAPQPKYVITKRPEGAKITRDQHAKEIVDAFLAVEEAHK